MGSVLADSDISRRLVHLTRGATLQQAYQVLASILRERELRGGVKLIRGGYCCVCFSEAPLRSVRRLLGRPGAHGVPYQPFGIVVSKRWLFQKGGRHVVYQREAEFSELPESHRWRHVRYEPDAVEAIDFSWEREWRIRTEHLPLAPQSCWVLVPSEEWRRWLKERFSVSQERALQYAELVGVPEAAALYQEESPWQVILLGS